MINPIATNGSAIKAKAEQRAAKPNIPTVIGGASKAIATTSNQFRGLILIFIVYRLNIRYT